MNKEAIRQLLRLDGREMGSGKKKKGGYFSPHKILAPPMSYINLYNSLRWDFKRIYCRDWPMVLVLSFSVRLPFFLVDNPAVDGPLYHNDKNGRLGGANER